VRKVVLMVLLGAATLGLAGSALAHGTTVGPGGSTKTGGQVTCGTSAKPGRIGPLHVYNNGGGAEVCSDSGAIQGRAGIGWSPSAEEPLPRFVLVEGDDDSALIAQTHVHIEIP
jgi:hypothetical protein